MPVSGIKKAVNALAETLLGTSDVRARPAYYDFFTYTRPVYVGGKKDVNSFLEYLSMKYDFKSIMVLKEQREIVGRCRWDSIESVQKVSDLFSGLQEKRAANGEVVGYDEDFNCLYLHADDWYSFYNWKDYALVVKASDTIPVPELYAIARDLVVFLKNGKNA
ncbi:MAG TPA: hypothetical protein VJA40_02295 [archaeon]|nr:hypothetical protein [archaeon]